MASDNKTLARFMLDGIPPAPRGMPQVEVSFDIDANGILSVKASDKASGKSQSVRIEATTALSKEEIERLKREAAEHAAEDEKKRKFIDVKNQAETLVYTAEKALRDAGDTVTDEIKKPVQEKIDALKKVLEGNDENEIMSATAGLSSELQKIGESLYNKKQDGTKSGEQNDSSGGAGNGETKEPS